MWTRLLAGGVARVRVAVRLVSALVLLALVSRCGGQSVHDDKAAVDFILFEMEYWEPYCEKALSCGRLESDCSTTEQTDFGSRREPVVECLERLRDGELDTCKAALVGYRDGLRSRSCEDYTATSWRPPWFCLIPRPGTPCIDTVPGPSALVPLPEELEVCRTIFSAVINVGGGAPCPLD
jgi:hypothetical protein